MPETEEQRRARQLREADQSARTMFNVFPQGTLESVGRSIQRTVSNPQGATMMAGSAGVNPLAANNIRVPEFPSMGPLVRTNYGLPPSERPEFRNPAEQWDARQVATRTASMPVPLPATPSAASVGQNLVTQQPIRPTVLPATLTQNRVIPETTPSVRPIQTPYGTIYASNTAQQQGMPTQAETFASRTTAFEGRTPEQQQALLAQVRQNGQRIASNYAQTMGTFAESRGARFASAPAPQGRYGQPLVENFPQSREAIAQRTERSSPFLASTGFGEMQRQQTSMVPPPIRTSSLFGGMGYASALGGPQPASSMMASGPTEDRTRRRIFGMV